MKKISYVIVLLLAAVCLFSQCKQERKEQRAKYVFYFIADGMGINQMNGAEVFLAEKNGKIGVEQLNFSKFPVASFATTYSKYNSVTCSAAAGTALATGSKTKNGIVGMDSLAKNPLYSVAVKAKRANKKVGIITSVSIDHATPASFYAHQKSRGMLYEIATDLPKTGFDLYGGAGFLQENHKKDSSCANIYDILKDSGYVVLRGLAEFEAKLGKANKAVLMQESNEDPQSLSYAIDRDPSDLSLAQLTREAIDFLNADNTEGFFLMVEGGKIDWAAHDNDAATTFHEVIDMAEAIQQAIDFYKEYPDETLIIVTADHETGGMALGVGTYSLNFKALQHQKVSLGQLTEKIKQLRKDQKNKVSWEDIQALLAVNMGFWDSVKLTKEQEAKLKIVYTESFQGKDVTLEKRLYSSSEPLARESIEIMNRIASVSWASGGHSASLVPVFAIGVGAELFQGRMDNTDIPKKIAKTANY